MTGAVCAVDIGTSAVRAALITPSGERLRQARRKRGSGDGGATFDAEVLWGDVREVLATLVTGWSGQVQGLAIAGHVGHVMVDEHGCPVTLAGGWADIRGIAEGGRKSSAQWTVNGRPAVTGGAIPALQWLQSHHASAHSRIRWVLAPKDFIILKLTGHAATDATSAAYTLGANVRTRSWEKTLIAPSGLSVDNFPPQYTSTDIVGEVRAGPAQALGLGVGVPVAAGGPDGTVGAAAVVGEQLRSLVDVAGTTDVIMQVLDTPDEAHPQSLLNPYVVRGLWSSGGATGMTGGAVAQWCRLLGVGSPAQAMQLLEDDLRRLPPGCDGLRISPLLTGSRFPDWNAHEHGRAWGMKESHSPAHFVRAAQEGAAFVVRQAVDILAPGNRTTPLKLAGGTARSASLAQLRANVLGRPVAACAEADVSLLGAALLALVAVGIETDLHAAQRHIGPELTIYEPESSITAEYSEVYEEWLDQRQRDRSAATTVGEPGNQT